MPDKTPIEWQQKRVPVDQLRPYERNPRNISDAAYARLKASLQELGYHQRIIAQPDLRVIGGHQRIKALKELGISEINVLVPSRELTEAEFKRLLVQDNLPFAGTGSQIIMGELSKRRVMAMELCANYVDLIVRRWQTFTGKNAILEGDLRTFAEIEISRG